MKEKGYTILELIIVVVIISTLLTLGIQYLYVAKENSLDGQAKSNLILIKRAENVYKIENGSFYPPASDTSVIATINSNLGLTLDIAASRAWNYRVWSTGCGRATRNGGNGRSWFLAIGDADNIPDAGAGCP